MSRLVPLALALLLAACAPRAVAFDPAHLPDPADLGPQNAATEWWYVSAYLPDSQESFHWAQFKVNYRGLLLHAGHIAVTDLAKNTLDFLENRSQEASLSFPPLRVQQGDWKLVQEGNLYRLTAGPLDLTLTPLKAPVLHPPGYSGTPEVGRMYYQSITRLDLTGTIAGKAVHGLAWLDHQWGDQTPGRAALWDWFGLHLSDGSDLMLYRVKKLDGTVVQLAGSRVGTDGVAREVKNLSMTPTRSWKSPTGRSYSLAWQVEADGLSLSLNAVRDDQELLAKSTSVAYWEGPVAGEGTADGQSIHAEGMGEFVGGALSKAEGGYGP